MIPLDQYDLATKYRYFGRPRKISLVDYHGQPAEYLGKPGDLVKPMVVPRNLLTNNVYLGDFGMAIEAGASVNFKPQQPFQFCAPERFHNVDPSPASDMWSYMTIVVALYTGFPPFHGALYEQVMQGWCDVLGPMPAHWKGHYLRVSDPKAINSDRWYDHAGAGHLKHSLASKVEKRRPDLSTEELNLAVRVFLKVLQYEPQDRLTAGQLLEDDDFNALLAIYGC
jgi:serine/threonine protein kinase